MTPTDPVDTGTDDLCGGCWPGWQAIGRIGDFLVAETVDGQPRDLDGYPGAVIAVVAGPYDRGDHIVAYTTRPDPDPFVAWLAAHDETDDMSDEDCDATDAWHTAADTERIDVARLGLRFAHAVVETAAAAGWTQADDGDLDYWLRHHVGVLLTGGPAPTTERRADGDEADRATLAGLLRRWARIRPCHVTGTHNPGHHLTSSCADQRAATFTELLDLAGLAYDDLPRALHEHCGHCHDVPVDEDARAARRASHAWANEPVPDALDAPGAGAPTPAEIDAVLDVAGRGTASPSGMWAELTGLAVSSTTLDAGRLGVAYRALRAVGALGDDGTTVTVRDAAQARHVRTLP